MSSESYEQALHAWVAAQSQPGHATQASCHGLILTSIIDSAPTALRPLLALQLSTRKQSPRLEAFRQLAAQALPAQIANESCCVLAIGGELVKDPDHVAAALDSVLQQHVGGAAERGASASGAAALTEIDHVLRGADAANRTADALPAILYGPPGAECFGAMHRAALHALDGAASASIAYVVRPVLLPGCALSAEHDINGASCLRYGTEAPPALSGYGIQLAVKSMEYSQVNDAAAPAAEQRQASVGSAANTHLTPELQQLSEEMGTSHRC